MQRIFARQPFSANIERFKAVVLYMDGQEETIHCASYYDASLIAQEERARSDVWDVRIVVYTAIA